MQTNYLILTLTRAKERCGSVSHLQADVLKWTRSRGQAEDLTLFRCEAGLLLMLRLFVGSVCQTEDVGSDVLQRRGCQFR